MKRKLFLSILIVFFTTSFLFIVGCNNQKDYQLQEQCGKRSEELFKTKYGNGTVSNEIENTHSIYQCHYNKKMNKCFILTMTDGLIKHNNLPYYQESLSDVNENHEYGGFYRTDTSVLNCNLITGKMCKNLTEWKSLIKPYMEE